MPKSLEYKDNRKSAYKSISDSSFNTEPKKLTQTKTVTRSDGDYIYDQMDIKTLFTLIEHLDRRDREKDQMLASFAGQFEYMYKNGFDEYVTMIAGIRAQYPEPTE